MVLLLCIWFKKVAWESKFLELFLPLEESLVATLVNEIRTPTYKKYIAEKGIRMPNLSEWLLSIKHVHLLPGGWTRYNNARFIRDTSDFLVVLPCFCFRKVVLRILHFWRLLWNLWWLFSVKSVHSLPDNMYLNMEWAFQIYQRNLNVFGHSPPFLFLFLFLFCCRIVA